MFEMFNVVAVLTFNNSMFTQLMILLHIILEDEIKLNASVIQGKVLGLLTTI